ncbi:hypothetical protein OGAPHI_005148 [Ogataea philodendri]|uniref:Eukaryotic translation initiation factor 3 subunit A n=1 Tax=Ogataea philodendri TaxID=1378263 RepID=A0A9P8P2D9_9ASCO|nr:uncharacterized protein OGAPHI_005148 [Ogataea philodendri]KAH3663746.1 hypothetical protein OGAPHI_005148 [Ogataea philodendri]
MAPSYNIRPENTLRRAEDLIAVGQKDAALQTLYDFVSSKRARSVVPADLEPIALLFVDLGVELRSGKLVKDGLHQYKKNVQGNEYGFQSVETVVKKFLDKAESKLNDAQLKADDVAATLEAEAAQFEEDDEDGEDDENRRVVISPEDVLMSSVSTDDTKDRSDRELVVPWLKFLWEAYRTVLDILRNNAKLEVGYAAVVSQAFGFCVKYNRKTEFKRLCEMLRTHLQTVTQKSATKHQIENPIDLSDPDTLQRYLETRFNQLNVSVRLELWQESFRTVEDVHTLMTISKRQPKPSMMVNYYDNLAKIFSVSDNRLFHAAARQKFFSLFVQSPIATDAELKHYASLQLLSVLAVPVNLSSKTDDFIKRKNNRLAILLNLSKVPTRESLLEQVASRNVLSIVDPVLAKLYKLMEKDLHPISFASEAKGIFQYFEENKEFHMYIKPLTSVILDKLFEQISQVYETVKLDFLVKLSTFEGQFKLTPIEIETHLLRAAASNLLSVKIDHEARVISFKADTLENSLLSSIPLNVSNKVQSTPTDLIRSHLSTLAKTLRESVRLIDPLVVQEEEDLKQKISVRANAEFAEEKQEILDRATILENRQKEAAEIKRRDEEAAAKARYEKLAAVKKAEQERVEQETAKRLEEKRRKELEAIQKAEKKKLLNEINAKGIIKLDMDAMEKLDGRELQKMQIDKLEQDRKVLEERIEATAKRFDYIERAQRKYEIPLLEPEAEAQKSRELEVYAEMKEKLIANAKKEHEESLKIKQRLSRLIPDYEQFVSQREKAEREAYEAKAKEAREKFEQAKQERIAAFVAKKKAEFEQEQKAMANADERHRKEAAEWESNLKNMTFTERMKLKRAGQWPPVPPAHLQKYISLKL